MDGSTTVNNNATLVLNLPTTAQETETAKDTFMKEVESYSIFTIGKFIDIYCYPFVISIGLVGSTLSFLFMMKPNNRKMSTCIYMANYKYQ